MNAVNDQSAKPKDDMHHVEDSGLETQKVQEEIHLRGAPIELSVADAAMQRSVNRRFDFGVLPILALMNFFNSLDKSNLANAQAGGFSKDLNLSPKVVNDSMTLYFTTFLIFQPVNAWIASKVGPKYWLCALMASWGVCVVGNAFVTTYGQVLAIRLLIGLFESGFTGISIYYLSHFYTRFDLGFRVGLYFALSAISGGFSGAIAFGILKIHGSLRNWEYLFIIEGALTILVAVLCLIVLPKAPSSAWVLNAEQKDFLRRREALEESNHRPKGGIKRDIVELAKDWKLWMILPFLIVGAVPVITLSTFLPIVLAGFGYKGNQANLMAVPPNLVGVTGLLLATWSSDRRRDRGLHIVGPLTITMIGSILVVTITAPAARYACLCILMFGAMTITPLTNAWLAGNTPDPGKRALVIGCGGWGYLSGVVGSQIFIPKYAPRYLTPFAITLALNVTAILGYLFYSFVLRRVNRSRQRKLEQMTAEEILAEEQGTERLGDKKWTYQYQT